MLLVSWVGNRNSKSLPHERSQLLEKNEADLQANVDMYPESGLWSTV